MEEKQGCEFCNTSNRLSEENGFLVVGKELLFHYELSECVVIKVKDTHSAIKIKKTALLSLMGYPGNHQKYTERI